MVMRSALLLARMEYVGFQVALLTRYVSSIVTVPAVATPISTTAFRCVLLEFPRLLIFRCNIWMCCCSSDCVFVFSICATPNDVILDPMNSSCSWSTARSTFSFLSFDAWSIRVFNKSFCTLIDSDCAPALCNCAWESFSSARISLRSLLLSFAIGVLEVSMLRSFAFSETLACTESKYAEEGRSRKKIEYPPMSRSSVAVRVIAARPL